MVVQAARRRSTGERPRRRARQPIRFSHGRGRRTSPGGTNCDRGELEQPGSTRGHMPSPESLRPHSSILTCGASEPAMRCSARQSSPSGSPSSSTPTTTAAQPPARPWCWSSCSPASSWGRFLGAYADRHRPQRVLTGGYALQVVAMDAVATAMVLACSRRHDLRPRAADGASPSPSRDRPRPPSSPRWFARPRSSRRRTSCAAGPRGPPAWLDRPWPASCSPCTAPPSS